MARPLPNPVQHRNGTNGSHSGRPASSGAFHLHAVNGDEARSSFDSQDSLPADGRDGSGLSAAESAELEHLQAENAQLRALCLELEQALQEAAQQIKPDLEQQIREYDAVLEEKNDMIRQLHQKLQEVQAAWEEAETRGGQAQPAAHPKREHQGPAPCEDELLALSEELERERRQLQEDEQALMQQMREMEVSMARERAEMARQRNDLQRLQSEIRLDLERLERNGAIQSKIESLKNKLQDATARRGAAPAPVGSQPAPHAPSPQPQPQPAAAPSRKEGLMGRLFGQGR
jgi:hypothetical protein